MNAEGLIAQLAQKSGVLALKLNEQGVASIISNDRYTTHLEKVDDGSSLMIYGVVGSLPSEARDSCLMSLMSANLFSQATAGASFGLNNSSMEIYFYRKLDLEFLDFEIFFNELEAFLGAQQHWTNYLEDETYSTEGKEEPDAPPEGIFMDKA